MLKKLMAKMQNEEGQGLVEYALIIVLVSIACCTVGDSWDERLTRSYSMTNRKGSLANPLSRCKDKVVPMPERNSSQRGTLNV